MPWIWLALGLAWTMALRAPVVLNANDHLDSDLAVDGLTLLDAVNGHWRWHYPGTPFMGSAPLLLSLPQSLALGVNAETLVSGGAVAWALVVVAVFLFARAAYGPGVACGAIVPLVFSSTGALWLSGRITGGHLFGLFWHAGALAGLAWCLNGSPRRWAMLGLWCGLGLWHDTMFVFTMAGLVAGLIVFRRAVPRVEASTGRPGLSFVAGLALGLVPAVVGRVVDPYDCYGSQFSMVSDSASVTEHVRLLLMECLPRLVSGHRLPDGPMFDGLGAAVASPTAFDPLVSRGVLALFLVSIGFAAWACVRGTPERRALSVSSLLPAVLVSVAFVMNRNIFNSDNYRYLVFWLVPWGVGFGLLVARMAAGALGRLVAFGLVALFALGMTADAEVWYAKHHWVGPDFLPRRARPSLVMTLVYEPAATHVFGDYWTVYSDAFLSGGKVVAIPLPFFPDRLPGWSAGLGKGRGVVYLSNPRPDWRGLFQACWEREGRDPREVDQLDIRWVQPLRSAPTGPAPGR